MRTERRLHRLGPWLAGLALLAAGCPGRLRDKERFLTDAGASACGDVVATVFVPKCGASICHGGPAPQQELDLVSPGVAARVAGVTAKGCAATLADPDDPASSLLYTKLAPTPPCGAQMPLAQAPLSDEQAACILDWIAGL
jgi:hypothetical protein